MSEWQIPLSDLDYGDDELEAVQRVLRSRWLSTGPEVGAFEREFADFLGASHAIAVANGTAALHLALVATVRPGGVVLQPALNFVAAANMTLAIGASPRFADILDVEEPSVDPAAVERLLTPHTQAVVAMHYGGRPARMAELKALCEASRVVLVEDACHALGARYVDPLAREPHGRMVGRLGTLACFSFFSNKNVATGEGGMVVTDDDELAARIRLLRSHGMTSLSWDRQRGHASSYDVVANGFNYRSDEIKAALGRAQLRKLRRNNARRARLVARYHERLAGLQGVTLLPRCDEPQSAFHLMVALLPDGAQRRRVAEALREGRIQTSMHYPLVSGFQAFAGYGGDLAKSQAFVTRALTLPLFPTMSEPAVDEVCDRLSASLAND